MRPNRAQLKAALCTYADHEKVLCIFAVQMVQLCHILDEARYANLGTKQREQRVSREIAR